MLFKTLVIFLMVSCISHYSYGQQEKKFFRNDYTYIESTEAFYKVHTQPKPWSEAKTECASEGAILYYPEDEREAHAVASFWTGSQPFGWLHIGISDLIVEGVFVTIDGIPISNVFYNWLPGEPNNAADNEDCVVMNKENKYNDDNCNKKMPFICKKTLKSLQWNQNCNLPDLVYRFNETLGRCYKLHTTPLSWVDAYAVCAAEQSYLTVINGPSEAEFVVKLADGLQVNSATGPYLRGAIHSGFHNRLNDGWKTVKGTTLADSGYEFWDTNQPGGNGEQCGSIFFNERLNDIKCDTKSIFVCEHDADIPNLHIDQRLGDTVVN